MKIILHRRNTIPSLKETPTDYGVEIDIRSHGEELIIHHDAFAAGVPLREWILHYRHGLLILNVKEEGLEERLISLMKERAIKDYFFLDQSFPFLLKWSEACEQRCAIRVSEFESIDTAMAVAGKAKWIWVDNFTKFPLTHEQTMLLRQCGYSICLVSPELHGRDETEVISCINLLNSEAILADAVCTKQPALWENLYRVK